MAMRYDTYDHSITYVNGTFSVLGHDLTSVVWRPGGDFAYVASSQGRSGNSLNTPALNSLRTPGRAGLDISCHRNRNVCILSTVDEGWPSSTKDTLWLVDANGSLDWVGVDCASSILNECVGFASGLRLKSSESMRVMLANLPWSPATRGTSQPVTSSMSPEVMTARV